MKHLQGTTLWRADTFFLKAVRVQVKNAELQLDSEGKSITDKSHFTNEYSAWKQLQTIMTARHIRSKELRTIADEHSRCAASELNNARDDYMAFMHNLKVAGFNL